MQYWNYLESKDVLGLCRVIERHVGKRRPFLFLTSFVPSLGTPIPMKKSICNIRPSKLPYLLYTKAKRSLCDLILKSWKNWAQKLLRIHNWTFFQVLAWLPKRPILGRNRNLKGSPCLLSIYSLDFSWILLLKSVHFKKKKYYSLKENWK